MADINSQLPTKITDGTLTATIRDVTGVNDALNVAITKSDGTQVDSFGGGSQYVEDVASVGAELMTLAGAVRRDTAASSSGTDGDYSTLNTDATGRLWAKATIDNLEANPIPVYVTSGAASGSEVNSYNTTAAVAASATSNHDYTVTGATMLLKQITFAASGKMKVELQVGPVGTLVSKGVWFISTASPSFTITFAQPIEIPVASTGTVRLVRTNLEAVSQDVYSTIIGTNI